MKNPHTAFILTTVIIHLLLLSAGAFFFGLDYALLLAFIWMFCWVSYCCKVQAQDSDEYSQASYLKLALVGGVFCWIICPWALVPSKHRANAEPVTWVLLMRLYQVLAHSVTRSMGILFSLTEEAQEEIAAQDEGGEGPDE